MDFKLGSERIAPFTGHGIQAGIRNQLKRDLSRYSGVKFFMKASQDLTIMFVLNDIQKETDKEESWFGNISVTQDWKEMQIPFNSLIIRKGKAKRHGTDQILDLKNIERINWVVHEMSIPPGTEGTIWLDEVSFY